MGRKSGEVGKNDMNIMNFTLDVFGVLLVKLV